jgi:hypothetical protein
MLASRLSPLALVMLGLIATSSDALARVSTVPPGYNQLFPPAPAPSYWQIKASGTITGVPANRPWMAVISIEKKGVGGNAFVQYANCNQFGQGTGNPINYDTGWISMNPQPVKGEQYRFQITVTYTDSNNIPVTVGNGTIYSNPSSPPIP